MNKIYKVDKLSDALLSVSILIRLYCCVLVTIINLLQYPPNLKLNQRDLCVSLKSGAYITTHDSQLRQTAEFNNLKFIEKAKQGVYTGVFKGGAQLKNYLSFVLSPLLRWG